jgi:hypothetical protein
VKGRAGGTSGLLHAGGCHGLGPLDTEEGHHIDLSRDGTRVEELVGTVLRGDVCQVRRATENRQRIMISMYNLTSFKPSPHLWLFNQLPITAKVR